MTLLTTTMQDPSPTATSFLPASEDDLPILIRIHMAGFVHDNPSRLMFENNDMNEGTLLDMLEARLSDPKFAVIKAVNKDTGNILGWQACRLLDEDDSLESKATTIAEFEEAKHEKTNDVRTLRSVLREDSVRVQRDWMADKKYIYFDTLVVDPAAQGHGIGTALVRWVTDKADEQGIYCWLQSSRAAHSIYLKAGYRDVHSLKLDLSEFAPGGKDGGWGFGVYDFRYMLRLPKT